MNRIKTSMRLFITGMVAMLVGVGMLPQVSLGAGMSYYVATNGSDTNKGTSLSAPFRTINQAVKIVKPGDTIFVRGGVYKLERTINPTVSGTENARILLRSYRSEEVTLDATNVNNRLKGSKAIRLEGVHYWTVNGINIMRAPGFGLSIGGGAHDIRIEDLDIHHNGGTGLSIENGAHTVYINAVNSYFNYDAPTGGEHADGFAVKDDAVNIIFNRCRAWNNSDDGWDFWGGGRSQITKSEAFNNGLDAAGKPYPNGDGNGFKLGGHYEGGWSGAVTLRTSMAYNNYASGFTWNNASLPNRLFNTTAYNNNKGDLSYAYNYRFDNADMIRNSISAGTGGVRLDPMVDDRNNSWNLGVEQPEFVSTSTGSSQFLYLSSGSPLIDRGVTVGLPFSGAAPDLGAFEAQQEWK